MSTLDLSDFDNGTMDKTIESLNLLHDTFVETISTAFVVDPEIPIKHVGKLLGIRSKYIDLSQTSNGDYNRFAQHLNQFKYDGLLIDNVDKIPNNEDREDWEHFIKFALKREKEFQPLPFGENINFDEMHIAVRSNEFPVEIIGKSLQCVIIGAEFNHKLCSDENGI